MDSWPQHLRVALPLEFLVCNLRCSNEFIYLLQEHIWHCKVAPESWGIGGSKVVSSKGLEGYKMFDPRDSRREDREEENA